MKRGRLQAFQEVSQPLVDDNSVVKRNIAVFAVKCLKTSHHDNNRSWEPHNRNLLVGKYVKEPFICKRLFVLDSD